MSAAPPPPIDVVRTPARRFTDIPLPGWHWGAPSYFTSRLFNSRVRLAYWDLLGDAGARHGAAPETVLLTHGEPSWSYLNRRLVQPLLDHGYRVVLFDQVGFGWSDKPVRVEDYTYHRHCAWNADLLFNHLDLREITAVLQDWGGLLGLRLAAQYPARFARLVVGNTAFPTADAAFEGADSISSGFYAWKDYCHSGALLEPGAIGKLLRRGTAGPSAGPDRVISRAEAAAYQAPFPGPAYCAGVTAFPELVPTPPHDPTGRPQPAGGALNRALWAVFERWTKPVLLCFAEGDAVLGQGYTIWQEKCPACRGQANVDMVGAGHFFQDGAGDQLAREMLTFMRATRSRL